MQDCPEFKENLEKGLGHAFSLFFVQPCILFLNCTLFYCGSFSLGLPWSFRIDGRSRIPRTKGFVLGVLVFGA